jgi:plastocyanin
VKIISLTLAALVALAVIAVAAQGASTSGKTLKATTGPGFTISLKNAAGKRVRRLRHGRYTIKVADKSNIHNFHLKGPGVNKKTTTPFVGSKTWHVKLTKGTYRYKCDIHFTTMHGSFKVR